MIVIQSLFWFAVLMIVYHHLGYPLLLRLLSVGHQPKHEDACAPATSDDTLPSITLIVPCHNEAAVIAAKIANLAALDYSADRLTVVVALDGCTDATATIVTSALAGVKLAANWSIIEYPTNIGKIAVLNDQIGRAESDIVALSDASALLDPDALRRAAIHFRQATIGVVCGTYRISESENAGERAYWTYQTRLKVEEATLSAPMGAHGAFYLFRRPLWSELRADTINDDFAIPMSIVLKRYRAVYDTDIVIRELERAKAAHEFRRRVRIGAGNLQQAIRLRALADPRRGWLAFLFLSGKCLRAFMPFLLLLAFVSSVVLAAVDVGAFRAVLVTELAIMLLAFAGLLRSRMAAPRPLRVLAYVFLGHAAAGLGCLLFLAGAGRSVWGVSRAAKSSAAPISESETLGAETR